MEYTVAVKLAFWVGFLLAGQAALVVGLVCLLLGLKGAARGLKDLLEEVRKWTEEDGDAQQ